jgi:O-antigen/teichoic acid export membrane protein
MFLPEVAGAYSVATRIGQVVLFGLTTMTTFLYPKFSMRSTDGLSYRKLFLPALLVLLIVGSITSLLLYELRAILVLNVFGPQYEDAMSWISYLCISALGLGLAHLAMHFMLAMANRQVVFVYLLFTLSFSVGILLSAMHSIQFLLLTIVAANWLLFGAMFILAFLARKIPKSLVAEH